MRAGLRAGAGPRTHGVPSSGDPTVARTWRREDARPSFEEFRLEDIEQSVPGRFERQVARRPDRLAVKDAGRTWTYTDLNRWANRIARAIVELRGTGEEPALLLLGHDATMVATLLGVLKAGKIVVPLDPTHPLPRLAALRDDSGAALVLTDPRHREVAAAVSGGRLAVLDVSVVSARGGEDDLRLALPPTRLMQIMYTSGSTGRPKGVMQSHRNVLHAVLRYTNPARVTAGDRLALLLGYGRVAGMLQVFRALLNGASLFPFELRRQGLAPLVTWLARERITVLQTVPSMFRQFAALASGPGAWPDLRLLHLSGELVSRHDVTLFRACAPAGCVLLNNYGATETATVCEYFVGRTTEVPGHVVPVGYPVAGMEVRILDPEGHEVMAGEVGEIAVRSAYVALGYWRDPELTRMRFRRDPDGTAVYHTGDLGRRRPDGCLLHLGRQDAQVKIRGNRVELAEIEMALIEHPSVAAAAVVAQGREPGSPSLAAYVVPRSAPSPAAQALRDHLRRTLPEFMIPTTFRGLETLPLTPEGKVDRRALAALAVSMPDAGRRPPRRPRSAVERRLLRIWEELLPDRAVGVRDDFFALGGHSLLAVRMMERIEAAFGRRLPPAVLFGGPTIERLARAIEGQDPAGAVALPVLLQPGRGRPVFLVPGGNRTGDTWRRLARAIGSEWPLWTLAALGDGDGKGHGAVAVEAQAAAFVHAIRTVDPQGPYRVAGLADGAVLAFETARQLGAAGEAVILVVLLATDAASPASRRRVGRAPVATGAHSPVRERAGEPGGCPDGTAGPARRCRPAASSGRDLEEALARHGAGPFPGRIVLVGPKAGALRRSLATRGVGRLPSMEVPALPWRSTANSRDPTGALAGALRQVLRGDA